MNASNIPHDNIERYLLGDMDSKEVISFEEQIRASEMLQDEVVFQRSIIRGIENARKAELKARLSNVPVDGSWLGNVMSSAWSKAVTGVVVAGTVSIFAYMQFDAEDTNLPMIGDPISIDAPTEDSKADWTLKFEKPSVPAIEESVTIESKQVIIKEHNPIADEVPKLQVTSVEIPDMEMFETQDEDSFAEPGSDLSTAILDEEVPLKFTVLTTEESRSYRYFEGELTLKGDFDNVVYDLIELNSEEGKTYFIEIEGKFFSMPQSQEYRLLELIHDKKLIKLLDSLSYKR
jgi:hypothetical protein